jgi:hypothetical protein
MGQFLCSYISERQKAGVIREMEPMVAGRAFIGMIIYHSLLTTLFDKSRTLLDIQTDRAAQEFTEIFLTGVLANTNTIPSSSSSSARRRAEVSGRRAPLAGTGKKKQTK